MASPPAYVRMPEKRHAPGAWPVGDDESEEEDDGSADVNVYRSKRGIKYYGHSCVLLDPTNPLRRAVIEMIDYGSSDPDLPSYFEYAIMVCIGLNAVHLASYNPAAPYDPQSVLELLFNVVFTVELVLYVIACGLIVPRDAVLNDLWGWLDLTIVIGGWLPYFSHA